MPKFHEVANAVGAAIASVSGEVDTIEILHGKSLQEAIERIKLQAIDDAVKTGADRNSTRIVDVDVLPIQVRHSTALYATLQFKPFDTQYVTNQATRIIVRAVGELDFDAHESFSAFDPEFDGEEGDELQTESIINPPSTTEKVDYTTYKPHIAGNEWILSETDLCEFFLCFFLQKPRDPYRSP